MDTAPKVAYKSASLTAQNDVSIVLFSCQTLLHELPSQKVTFTQENFPKVHIVPLMKSDLRIMFYAREPCRLSNWSKITNTVALHLSGLQKEDLAALANYIASKLGIEPIIYSTRRLGDNSASFTDG